MKRWKAKEDRRVAGRGGGQADELKLSVGGGV